VSVDRIGQFHFNGPRCSITVQPTEVFSMAYWWMDWLSVSPRYIRTAKGNFFLPPGLRGPTDLFGAIETANPLIELRRRPL
jgi:hypothetical protein